ncbi:MAG: glycosyltransferase family 4 protein [Myxococcota bacterium]|nr:glycosyltransferase family 4 protein [Myxococcota bacterium]
MSRIVVRPSVAHVTTISESLEILLLDQLKTIAAAGYEVAGLSAPGRGAPALESAGIRHVPVPFVRASQLTPAADLRAFASMVATFRRERFTIVHTHTAKADLYAAMAARLAGVPIVITTLHGFLFHDLTPPRRRAFYARLAKLGMRFCDLVLSQSSEDVETAVREHICPASKIELLGNGIDVDRFDRARIDPDTTARLRAELGIADDAIVVGFVGRLVDEKGVRELLSATASLRTKHPKLRVLLVGWYDEMKADAVRPETASRYGVEDVCVFTGHRRDLPELYSLMDIFVLPSHREGVPRTAMEASAMGIPVVATRIRGCRTVVDDQRTGLLVEVKAPEELAAALDRLLRDRSVRVAMGGEGRRRAEQHFDQRTVFAKVLSAYDRLLTAKSDKMRPHA